MLIFDQILISLSLCIWRDLKQLPSGVVEISHFPEWGRAYWTADSRMDKQTHVSLGQSNDAESDDVPVRPSTSRSRRWSLAWHRRREGERRLRSNGKSCWWKHSTSHTAYGQIAYTKYMHFNYNVEISIVPDSCGPRWTENNGLILGPKNKISGTAVCDNKREKRRELMQREGAAAAAAAAVAAGQMHPRARCYSNILHHSWTELFASASGAHLQSVFTTSESGTVFTGARTRFTVWCAVLLRLFFFSLAPAFWLRPALFHASAPASPSASR